MIKYIKRIKTYRNKKNKKIKNQLNAAVCSKIYTEDDLKNIQPKSSLTQNVNNILEILGNNADLVIREIKLGRRETIAATILYFDNLMDPDRLDSDILRPLVLDAYTSGLHTGADVIEQILAGNLITRAELKRGHNFKDIINRLLSGEVALIIDGLIDVFIISSKGYDYRFIAEPDMESVVRGPRDSFIETLSVNIGLIRRRIKSPNLVIESLTLGRITQTTVVLTYLKGLCQPEMVAEVRQRLNSIDIDGVLESGYIEELIQDNPYSPFPTVRVTERPDIVSAALLEGRVALVLDNTPMALIVPAEFFSLMQSPEDYYNNYIFSTSIRLLRYIAFTVALLLPASYIAVTTYHQEMIPTELLMSIISSRIGVPLPAFLEALVMEISFELLREAGVRLPRPIGQAVSIVGALVVGQAAVQAALISPLMVIVVALTGIASFTIPQYSISLPIRILRFPLMILAAFLGLFGVMAGVLAILLHLSSLRSFGVPYLAPFTPFHGDDIKDSVVRFPWWMMVRRPSQTNRNLRRMPSFQKPHPPQDRGDSR